MMGVVFGASISMGSFRALVVAVVLVALGDSGRGGALDKRWKSKKGKHIYYQHDEHGTPLEGVSSRLGPGLG